MRSLGVGKRPVSSQAGRVRQLPEADVEADEGAGDGEERVGEGHVAGPGAVDEDEVLDALGGEEVEPARELGMVRAHVAAHEVDTAEGPRMRLEDGGDGGGDGRRVGRRGGPGVVVGPEVGVDQVGLRGAPDRAPAGGERGGARGVGDGEAADDVAQERAGEAADAVEAVGGGDGGEAPGVGEGEVGDEVEADVGEQLLRCLVKLVRVEAPALHVGRRGGVQVGEPRPTGHGRRRRMSRRGFGKLVVASEVECGR